MMKHQPFSICIDGSHDTGMEKINPITLPIYVISGKIVHPFFDMCETTTTLTEAIHIALNEDISVAKHIQSLTQQYFCWHK